MKSFVLCATTLFLVGFLIFSHFGMEMEVGGQMTNCPFMPGQAAICTMNPLEHIAVWQNMFTVLVQENTLIFLISASFIFLCIGRLWGASHILSTPAPYILRRRVEIPIVSSPLQVAFLRGTLHPKIF